MFKLAFFGDFFPFKLKNAGTTIMEKNMSDWNAFEIKRLAHSCVLNT